MTYLSEIRRHRLLPGETPAVDASSPPSQVDYPPVRLESTLDGFTWEVQLRVDPLVALAGGVMGFVVGLIGFPVALVVLFVVALVNGWVKSEIAVSDPSIDLTLATAVYLVPCAGLGEISRRLVGYVAERRSHVVFALDAGIVAVRRGGKLLAEAPVGEVFVGVDRSYLRVGSNAFTLVGVSAPELTWLARALRDVIRDRGASDEVPAALGRLRAPEQG